jgi:hypothetical protein
MLRWTMLKIENSERCWLFANLRSLLFRERFAAIIGAAHCAGLLANGQTLLVRTAPGIGSNCGRGGGQTEEYSQGSSRNSRQDPWHHNSPVDQYANNALNFDARKKS